jgi:ankyrin repeat protein
MDYLCECNNDRDRREALNKLPPDLPSSYERILERVNRSSIENQAIVMKTLHWIVYADYDYIAGDGSLLTTEMLLQALAIRDGEEFFEQSSMASEEEVFHWCSSLVRRSNSGYLELAHFTVKEFLQTIDPVQKPHFRHYCLSGDHTILAKACLNFIQCPQFAGFSPIMMDYDGGECTSTYKFISYACEHWPYHAHNSRWDDIQGNVNRIFDMENTFMRWIQADFHMPRDQFISKYLAHPQPPSSLHWAALFGLDKFCATLLLRGMNPSQQSSMGTPLICAMLSRSVICNMVEGPIQSDRSWQPQARQSVIRHLLEAGLDLELPVDAKGQRRALTVALDLERFYGGMKRFVVSMLLDFGARVSVEDFDIIRRQLESFVEGGEIDALLEYGSGDELCGIYPWRLIDIITRQGWRALVRGTEFDFFSFVLEIASCNWPPGTFQSFFQVDFQDVLPCTNGSELTKLLRNESEHWKSKLIHVLSKAIVISAPDAGQAISRLQRSFFYAEATGNASVASLLLAFNPDLNASRRDLRTREIIRHLSPQTSTEHAKDTEINKSLSLHRARLLLPDESGISPIEYAAYGCSADIFRLYWDAAAHDEEDLSLDISIEIVEKTLKKAIESRNGPVMSLLIGKLFHSEIMPDDTLLEFAVCQEIPTFLEAILDFEKSRFPSHERTWNNLMQNERGYDDLDRTELQAFYLAAKPGGSINNFAFLLERGLPISHQYQDGITALHVLAANNDEESFCKLQALLKTSKQNLDMCTKSGMPPLAHAIISGNLKGMELLLDAGANPGVKVMEDLTSLHIACYIGNLAAVETLLRHGSQTSLNNQGSLAKYIALGRGHHEIAAAIQDTIDSTTNSAKTHPETSSSKGQLLDTPSSDFAETEDHGGLPLLPKQK